MSAYHAKEAESWARDHTGIRQDENTNNSEFWCQQSQLHKSAAEILLNNTTELLQTVTQQIIDFDFEITDDGELIYESDTYDFEINDNGKLEYWIQQEEEIRLKEKCKKSQHNTRAPANCHFHKKVL